MGETTPRFALPLLEAGQAQKEMFHNEALIALEALIQPVAETLGDDTPPSAPIVGRSWIVGPAPNGAWAGQAGAVASWGDGGWRFVTPVDGMCLWVAALGLWARRAGGAWTSGLVPASALLVGGMQVVGGRQGAIADPTGGGTVDAEARAALLLVLRALRVHGLIDL